MKGGIYQNRSRVVLGCFLAFSLLLLGRLFHLQCRQYSRYRLRARGQHQSVHQLSPRRGTIYDSRGRMLAASVPRLSLFADPSLIPAARRDEIAAELSRLVDLDASEIRPLLSAPGRFAWIRRHLEEETALQIRELGLPGIGLQREMERVYPKGTLFSQVLGFTDPEGNGLEGLELRYDHQLRGRPGWLLTERDRDRREAAWHRSPALDPLDGCDLHLTVDEVIQAIIEEELDRAWREHGAAWASALVMEPETGRILALANRPTFDPNVRPRPPAEERRNRAITDPIEPGSTFKVFAAAGALEAGVVSPGTEFYCENGFYRLGGRTLRDTHSHGVLRFDEIIKVSSNIGMAKVGNILGRGGLYRALSRFEIGRPTGIELPGESPGVFRHPRHWSSLSLGSITMGYEVSLTPLALLTAFCAIGNGGVLVQPRIVDRVVAPGGEVIHRYPVQKKGRAVSEETARRMREILQLAVEGGGTGRRAAIPGVSVAGKTGTARKVSPLGGYSSSRYRALFMGLIPADRPRLAILVVVDEPRPAYYGGVVAAPVFREAGKRIIRYLDLEPAAGKTGEVAS